MIGLSDAALLVCIERRRPAALAEVVRRHGGALHAVGTRVCGAAQAEAVAAEVLMELWAHPQRFDPEASSLRAFLLGQAHARVMAAARAAGVGPPCRADSAGHDIDDHAERVLSGLPDAERTVIAMAYLDGYRSSEIAESLMETVPVVATRIRNGLRRLGQLALAGKAGR